MMSGKTKKVSFMNLVYREFALSKSTMKLEIVILVFFYLICFMITLSSRFGNLANVSNEFADTKSAIMFAAKFYGIYASFVLFFSSTNISKYDIQNKSWLLFRKSLPVSPTKLAAAKFTYLFLMLILSIGLSFVYLGIDGMISESGINRNDTLFLYAVAALLSILCVSNIVCMEFTKSYDIGGIMSLAFLIVLAAVLIIPNKEMINSLRNNGEELGIYAIVPILEKLSGFFILSIIASFVLGFFFMTLIYRRRDK